MRRSSISIRWCRRISRWSRRSWSATSKAPRAWRRSIMRRRSISPPKTWRGIRQKRSDASKKPERHDDQARAAQKNQQELQKREAYMGSKITITGRPIARRSMLAGAAAGALAMPFISRRGFAAGKPFRISTPGTPDEWQSKALEEFKKQIDASNPGMLDVQIHYNGTLFAQGTEIEAMQRGNLEVGMVSPQDIATLIKEYSIFTTGYLMRDPAHLDAVYDGDIGKEYAARVEKDVQIHLVRSQYLGTRHVILRKEKDVNTPADMAGLKLRMPGSEAWQFLGNALGAQATPLAFEEVYLAMQTGTIDGLEN